MMKWKKIISGILAFSMVAGSVVSAAPIAVSAANESRTESNTATQIPGQAPHSRRWNLR